MMDWFGGWTAAVVMLVCACIRHPVLSAGIDKDTPQPVSNRKLVTDIIKNITSDSSVPGEPLKFPPQHQPPLQVYEQRTNMAAISAFFDINWVDDKIQWNPENYSGAKTAYVPASRVWIPELYLYHSVQGSKPLHMDDSAVQINDTGGIRAFVPFTARAFCPIDVRHFPFDEQICQFKFGSWSYLSSSLEYIMENTTVFLDDFYDNQEWLLTGSNVTSDILPYDTGQYNESYSMIVMTLTLKRQSFYYIFNLVMPVTMVSVVTVVGFHTRMTTDGRRVAKFRLGIMALLSMGVSLLMVVNDMPKFALESIPGQRGSFSAVPLLGLLYIGLITVISTSTCFVQLFIGLEGYALRHPDVDSIPACLRWLVSDCPCCRRTQTNHKHKYNCDRYTSSFRADLHRPPSWDGIHNRKAVQSLAPVASEEADIECDALMNESRQMALSSSICSPTSPHQSPSSLPPVPGSKQAQLESIHKVLGQLRTVIVNLTDAIRDIGVEIQASTPKQLRPHWLMLLNRLEDVSLAFFVSCILMLLIGFFTGPYIY